MASRKDRKRHIDFLVQEKPINSLEDFTKRIPRLFCMYVNETSRASISKSVLNYISNERTETDYLYIHGHPTEFSNYIDDKSFSSVIRADIDYSHQNPLRLLTDGLLEQMLRNPPKLINPSSGEYIEDPELFSRGNFIKARNSIIVETRLLVNIEADTDIKPYFLSFWFNVGKPIFSSVVRPYLRVK